MPSTKYWCFIRSSFKLRSAIKLRMNELGVGTNELARRAEVPKSKVSRYLNNKDASLSQAQLIKVAEVLGLRVTLNVTLS